MPAQYLEERIAELEAKVAKLENTPNAAPPFTKGTQPTLEEIYRYFEPHFPGMVHTENHYVHSRRSANDTAFFIKSTTPPQAAGYVVLVRYLSSNLRFAGTYPFFAPRGGVCTRRIQSNSAGVLFHWETDHEERSHLRETYPKIKALFPSAILKPSRRYPERITRILIPIDQTRPLENIHSIIKATRTIAGF